MGMPLNPRILSRLEERYINAFLKQDGEKNVNLRVLAFQVRKHLPEIRRELELLEKFARAYQKAK
jgi:hypothetical protein